MKLKAVTGLLLIILLTGCSADSSKAVMQIIDKYKEESEE